MTHVISIRIGVRTITLEIRVIRHTRTGARCGRIKAPRTTIGTIRRIAAQIRHAGALTTYRESSGVERTFERGGAVWSEVDWAVCNGASLVVGDSHGEVVAVDEGDVVVVAAVVTRECPFRYGCGWNACSCMWVAK
jgi:hypothetical protein